MPGVGYKSQIAQKLVERIELVTIANGYTQDIKTVSFDKIKLNIADYNDTDLPAVQIIDQSKVFKHVRSTSESSWFVVIELCMRSTQELGVVDQQNMWDLQEDVMRSIMADPTLGLSFMFHVKLIDSVTDLHLQEPNYTATIGLEILYKEPITSDNC